MTDVMALYLPNPYSLLFVDHTIIACDDWEKACTEFTFQIKNNGDTPVGARYKVSVVGGATLYDSTIASLNPGETSVVIDDWVCALPGGLPVGTHTIKVEVGPTGQSVTDTKTEDIFVIPPPQPVSQPVYVQYWYQQHGYLLPNATITIHRMTGPEVCESSYDGTSTGCTFELESEEICDATVEKEYYKTNGDSYLANFTVPVEPYILLWLYPREPSVTTSAATEVTSTSAILNGELTDLDGIDASQTCFQYGEVGSSHTTLDEWTLFEPGAFSQTVTGLTPNTTYNFRIRGTNETEEDTFYVFGETKQFTTLAEAAPPVVYTYDTDEITESGALLRGYLGTSGGVNTDIGFEYGKTDSYGTMIWTDVYTEPGYYTKAITGLDPNTLYHLRAIASNVYGTGYGTDKTFTTLESTAANMHIILPNANGKLFLSNTVIACDDPDDACTEFRFQIRNDGNTTMAAWYKVSVVGGATLYDGGIVEINPGATSIVIDDTVCALPGGLPVGTHAIKVETGPIGQAATDTYTEPLYVMGEGTAPSGVYTTSENYVNVCGAEIANNCITVDVFVEHFGSDSECDVYLEYWSIGDTEHNFTDPITVPYDPEYDEYGGFELQGVTSCISDCERDFHVRAVASNSVGSNHSETVSPITVRLDPVEYVTETTATLRADILSMGTVSSGVWMFRYGTPTPNTWTTVTSISDTGPLGVTIHELEPNTTYQYYFLARNRYGYPQTFSTTASFTTLGAEPPQVTTGGAFVVNDTTVELEGTLTSTGGASTCDLYFRYGYDESCIHSSKDYSVYDTAGSPSDFILTIGGLTEGATLYYRAAAKCNGLEEVVGGLKQIALPAPTYDITFVATAPGISDLHNVDVNDITDPQNPLYLGKT